MQFTQSTLLAALLTVSVSALDKPRFTKFFQVVFENTDYEMAASLPYFKKVAAMGRSYTNMHGLAHPSQPNYIAMIAGSTVGVVDDANHDLDAPILPDLLEKKGKTWKTYQENYMGGCNTTASDAVGLYERKHNPFISFKSVRTNAARCAMIVDETQLKKDIAAKAVPDYVMYVPNQVNDGHGQPPYPTPTAENTLDRVKAADTWFSNFFPSLLADPQFKDTLFL
ncbi:hypothetical protein HDU91_001334 [Kappamyces sp. JEL0680]|nr:hypothetical protein HDU91_001334 [Kappamyces sp. JEL0680]